MSTCPFCGKFATTITSTTTGCCQAARDELFSRMLRERSEILAFNPISLAPLVPGQMLVIHSPQPLSPVQREKMTKQLRVVMRAHGNTFIFLDGDFKVGVGNPQPVKP